MDCIKRATWKIAYYVNVGPGKHSVPMLSWEGPYVKYSGVKDQYDCQLWLLCRAFLLSRVSIAQSTHFLSDN